MAAPVKKLFFIIFIFSGSVSSFDWFSILDIRTFLLPTYNLQDHPREGRIVGGHDASIEEHPYQVSFIVNNSYFCGGVIVSEEFILTAAHCAQNVDPTTMKLRIGSSFRTNGTLVAVAKVTPHPNYNDPAFDNDIAVIELVEAIEFSDVAQPIDLPAKGTPVVADTTVVVSGWGKQAFGAPTIPTHLMAVEIPVVKHEYCKFVYSSVLTDNEWCGGHFVFGGKGPCQGDSGGPAVQELVTNGNTTRVLKGIVSYSRGCGYPLSPSVFTNVAAPAMRDFINEITGL